MTTETLLALTFAFTSPQPAQPAQPAVLKYATVTKIETSYRNPTSHTHSPGCGHTFDHSSTSGHNCPALVIRNGKIERCGAFQNIQDRSPRKVTITTLVRGPVELPAVDAPPTAISPPPRTAPVPVTTIFQGYSSASGGCASGNCAYPQAGRRR